MIEVLSSCSAHSSCCCVSSNIDIRLNFLLICWADSPFNQPVIERAHSSPCCSLVPSVCSRVGCLCLLDGSTVRIAALADRLAIAAHSNFESTRIPQPLRLHPAPSLLFFVSPSPPPLLFLCLLLRLLRVQRQTRRVECAGPLSRARPARRRLSLPHSDQRSTTRPHKTTLRHSTPLHSNS